MNDPADAPLSSIQPERVVFGEEDLKPHLTPLRLCMRDRPRSYQQGIRARYVIMQTDNRTVYLYYLTFNYAAFRVIVRALQGLGLGLNHSQV